MTEVYLDHAATSPLRPEVREAMAEWAGVPCNPSASHRWGRRAAAALEGARARVAGALGAHPREVFFVRGGTEGVNLALLGVAGAVAAAGDHPRVLATAIEHRAVLDTAPALEALGGRLDLLPVGSHGTPDLAALDEALRSRPSLVSVMAVNNETGTILPLAVLAERCQAAGVPLHTDAIQAVGRIPLDLRTLPVTLLSLSGHKLGGPVGCAALIVRSGTPLVPRIFGGGQEGGLRPGTPDVAGAVGLAEAVVLAITGLEVEAARLEGLRGALEAGLRARIPGVSVHGAEGERAPHILNLGIPDIDPGLLVPALDLEGIAASRGSACSSGGGRPSHVLRALAEGGARVGGAPLRLSLGWSSSAADVDAALRIVPEVTRRLRGAVEAA
jgi:cysteine desulfurase